MDNLISVQYEVRVRNWLVSMKTESKRETAGLVTKPAYQHLLMSLVSTL